MTVALYIFGACTVLGGCGMLGMYSRYVVWRGRAEDWERIAYKWRDRLLTELGELEERLPASKQARDARGRFVAEARS